MLTPITESELVAIIHSNNLLPQIVRTIKEIDKTRNGFVTSTELDDIFKVYYPFLENRDIKQVLKQYQCV